MSETGKSGKRTQPPELVSVSSQEALELFDEGARVFASVIFWTPDQKHVVHSELTFLNDQKKMFQVAFSPEFDPQEFARALDDLGSFECIFSLSFAQSNVFFKATFDDVTETGIQFQLPEKVFKVQKRKNPRFQIPDEYVIRVTYPDPLDPETTLNKRVWDLSAGGLSFYVSAEEEEIYQTGLQLKGAAFLPQNKPIIVDAEVRHKSRSPKGPKATEYKVGVSFNRMDPADLKRVITYLSEESRKYYSRFV